MPQPENWDDEERELLQSAELDAPATGAQNRTLAALGIGGAALSGAVAVAGSAKAAGLASAGPSSAISTAATSGKGLLLGKLLAAIVVVGAAGGAWLHYQTPASAPPIVVARTSGPTKAAEVKAIAAAPVEPAPAVAVASPDAAPSVAKSNGALARSEPDIALEIEALDRARRAEGRGDFATALSELDQYDHTFKQGRLRPEALVLRVQTLLGKGDSVGAKALGSRFLAHYPKSPLVPRIQKLIGAGK